MASDSKDEQSFFEFVEVDGPEKPALEAEDPALLDLEDAAQSAEDDEPAWEPSPEPAHEEPEASVAEKPLQVRQAVPQEIPVETEKPSEKPIAEPVAPMAAVVPVSMPEPAVVVEAAPESAPETEAAPIQAVEEAVEEPKPLKPADITRAALAWMARRKPTAVAAKVPTRLKKYCAGVAAFWSEPGRRKKLLKPQHTVIVEVRCDREACLAEGVKNSGLLPELHEAKRRKVELEAEIRVKEPHLKDANFLFPEIERWDYMASSDKEYRKTLKRIETLERAVNNGSRFERIRQAKVANELYLAVPEGAIKPEELADGWGLLYVSPTLEATVVREAEAWDCPEENMMHLAQNVAASALRDVLFSHGVHLAADGSISIIKPPRRRRPLK